MIKFGPAGNSESFYAEGKKTSLQMPEWISGKGLDLFEYSFGKGVTVGEATATAIGKEAAKYGIEMSVHAPYYINFANPDDVKGEENSIMYLLRSMTALRWFGGIRCVFHSGTEGKLPRGEAVDLIARRLAVFAEVKKAEGFADVVVCPETMGKIAQIGTVDEIIRFCKIDESFYPCLDFGHINSREGGTLKTARDFERVVLKTLNGLGEEKTKNMHVHFSKIQYSGKGEIRHLTFADDEYGPEFEPLAEVFCKYSMTPYVVCESAGTQAEDALYMKNTFNAVK